MRLLELHMENFGPYRDAAVDFTAFDTAGVFLISGKTGSGKTTIFDAMVYALYGVTTGGERSGEEMRSKFAAPDAPTRVTLTFSHAGHDYRIKREPAQVLAKKRGAGVTNRPAGVTLTESAAGQETAEWTKERDVRPRIERLLHLNANQFRQMVLLPQGQFRQFLDASSDDKAALLGHLFNTGLYGRWQEALKARAKAATQATAQAAAALEASLAQFDYGDAPVPENTALPAAKLAAMQTAVAAQASAATAATAEVEAATRQREAAAAALTAGQQLAAAYADRQAAQVKLDQLAAAAAEIQAKAQRVTDLRWVAAHQATAAAVAQAKQTAADWQARVAQAVAAQPPAQAALQAATAKVAELAAQGPANDAAKQQLADSANLRRQLTELATLRERQAATEAALAAAKQMRQTAQTAVTAAVAAVAATAKQQAALEASSVVAASQAAAQQLAGLRPVMTQRQEAVARRDQLEAQLTEAQAAASSAQTAADAAKTRYVTLHDASLQDQIATLVAQLSPGQPCPVCGSPTHPAPHVVTATKPVSQAELEAADAKRQATAAAAAAAQTRQAALTTQVATADSTVVTLTQTLAHRLGDEAVESAFAALTARAAALAATVTEEAAERERLATQYQTQTAAQAAAEADQTQAETAAQQAAVAAATATAACEQAQAALPAAAPSLAELTATTAKLTQQVAAFADQQAATQAALQAAQAKVTTLAADRRHAEAEAATAATASDRAAADWQQTLAAWSPQGAEAFAKLVPDLPQLDDLAGQVTAHGTARAAATALFTQAEAAIAGAAAPDLPQLEAAATAAEAAHTATVQAATAAMTRHERNATLLKKSAAAFAANQAAGAEAAELANLAAVVTGNNDAKLSLERYVLRAYLADVLTVANPRLSQLTGGRYQFALHDEKGSHKNDTGLEIDVYDDQVGETRSVHTLSGGESFIAALCLALALGTVIQRESGGISIDALFVDEGFGSLDTDSLNKALAALEAIDGKAMIGIISHVSELREGIPDQLRVTTTGAGDSRLTVVHLAE